MDTNWIEASLLVGDVDQAVELYVNKWKLFEIENSGGASLSRIAMLRYTDKCTPFRLVVVQSDKRMDSKGRIIPAASHAKLSLPKSNFRRWVTDVFGKDDLVEYTPWSESVVLVDPWGHMFTIDTFEPDVG